MQYTREETGSQEKVQGELAQEHELQQVHEEGGMGVGNAEEKLLHQQEQHQEEMKREETILIQHPMACLPSVIYARSPAREEAAQLESSRTMLGC
jgi:hypothetical protein